jgi:ATP-dependent DNA helicase RecQ
MREWRRGFARQRGVPAFMILNDASLADLCCKEPRTLRDLLDVTGIGEKKAQSFGNEILAELHHFSLR